MTTCGKAPGCDYGCVRCVKWDLPPVPAIQWKWEMRGFNHWIWHFLTPHYWIQRFFIFFPSNNCRIFAAQCWTLGHHFSSPRKPIFKQQIAKIAPISPISMIKNGSKMAQVTQKNIPSDFKCPLVGTWRCPGTVFNSSSFSLDAWVWVWVKPWQSVKGDIPWVSEMKWSVEIASGKHTA